MSPDRRRRRIPMVQGEQEVYVVLLRADTELARWPLPCSGRPHLDDVDRLARLQLTARRLGCSIRLVGPPTELTTLLGLLGLDRALGVSRAPRRSERCGETEDGEEVGVEEVVVPDDPVA